jgi:hypothetical protein
MRSIPPTATALVCISALAPLVAGCGGSSNPGVAHLGTTATTASAASGEGSSAGGSASSSGGGGGSAGAEHSEAAIAGGGGPEAQKQMVAFAQCMRSHGEPDFPEPTEGKLLIKGGPHNGLNPGSPQFQSAMRACGHLMPNHAPSPAQSAELQAKALKFSACMREHGVPNFPDPKFSGGGAQLRIGGPSSGINPRSPQFQAAQKTCQGDLPGSGPKGSVSGGPGGPP